MIVKMAKGGDFKGVAAYILHDKRATKEQPKPQTKTKTSGRVGDAYTLNCGGDPQGFKDAVQRMIQTVEAAPELKKANGIKATGNKLKKPVKHIMLSWEAGENPSKQEQLKAVGQFLKKMGWQDHQALVASHTDTDKPHVHILLNRVNPKTGKTLNESHDYKRADRWALQYMREHGRTRIDQTRKRQKKFIHVSHRTAAKEVMRSPRQAQQASHAKRHKAAWHKAKTEQTKAQKGLKVTHVQEQESKGAGFKQQTKEIPQKVLEDVGREFAGRFEAIKNLPKEQRHGARENLKAEIAARRFEVRQRHKLEIAIERLVLKQEQQGERVALGKAHKEQRQGLSQKMKEDKAAMRVGSGAAVLPRVGKSSMKKSWKAGAGLCVRGKARAESERPEIGGQSKSSRGVGL